MVKTLDLESPEDRIVIDWAIRNGIHYTKMLKIAWPFRLFMRLLRFLKLWRSDWKPIV
jgi:hypothetical protein